MLNRMKVAAAVAAMVAVCAAGPARAGQATDEVRKTVDEVVRIVSDKDMKKPAFHQKRRDALRAAIGRAFDYGEMTRKAMGASWKQRTPAEQAELTRLFSALLEKTYAGKIESYNNEKIVYTREIIEGDTAEVKSRVLSPKGDEYSLDYRLRKGKGGWLVYDVVIEGVSLVSNYRTQFSKIMQTGGYSELVHRLKSKGDQ